jgi:hypothetical protein
VEAQLVAAFVTLGCLVFFLLIARPPRQPSPKISNVPVATPQPFVAEPAHRIDPNEQFRRVPSRWAPVDFKHNSYGQYKFSKQTKIDLTLKNGEYEYDFSESRGWFWLHDVYYVDVTDDQIPEAIVDLAHVECGGGSCDGGSDLIFIYSINAEGQLKELFQYETGSYAYGCGLKSLTVKGKEVWLELFGRCRGPAMDNPSPAKFMVKDRTRLGFLYVSKGFLGMETQIITSDVADLRNYRPEVHINE